MLAELSRRPLLYQALISFDREPQIHRFLIAWFDHCHTRGLRVYPQAHTNTTSFTFTLEDWNLFDDSEAWREATLGSTQERLVKLSDPRRRAKLKDYANGQRMVTGELENFVIEKIYTPRFKHLEGLTLRDAGGKMDRHLVDAMLEIAIADELRTVFDAPPPHTRLDLLKEIVNYPYTIPGLSDGGAHTKFFCGGRYPTEFLASFTRDQGMLSLEEAHSKLSTWPAICAGLRTAACCLRDMRRISSCTTMTVWGSSRARWCTIFRAANGGACNAPAAIDTSWSTVRSRLWMANRRSSRQVCCCVTEVAGTIHRCAARSKPCAL
jgi:N-acyl-D-amino-acid deacylase